MYSTQVTLQDCWESEGTIQWSKPEDRGDSFQPVLLLREPPPPLCTPQPLSLFALCYPTHHSALGRGGWGTRSLMALPPQVPACAHVVLHPWAFLECGTLYIGHTGRSLRARVSEAALCAHYSPAQVGPRAVSVCRVSLRHWDGVCKTQPAPAFYRTLVFRMKELASLCPQP